MSHLQFSPRRQRRQLRPLPSDIIDDGVNRLARARALPLLLAIPPRLTRPEPPRPDIRPRIPASPRQCSKTRSNTRPSLRADIFNLSVCAFGIYILLRFFLIPPSPRWRRVLRSSLGASGLGYFMCMEFQVLHFSRLAALPVWGTLNLGVFRSTEYGPGVLRV